jgi:hypothetical protein
MVVDDRTIECHSDLKMFKLGGPIKELPVFVRLDFLVPANAGDRVATRKERVADHVTPACLADAFVFAAMHPNATPVHQRAEEHRTSTTALADGKNVELVLDEPLIDAIEMKIRRDNLIVVKQEDELGICSVDGCVTSYANTYIVLLKIDHMAMLGGLRIFGGEPVLGKPIVNDDYLWFAEFLS